MFYEEKQLDITFKRFGRNVGREIFSLKITFNLHHTKVSSLSADARI